MTISPRLWVCSSKGRRNTVMVFTPNKVVDNCCHEHYGDLDQTRLCLLDFLSWISRSLDRNHICFRLPDMIQQLKVSDCTCTRSKYKLYYIINWNSVINFIKCALILLRPSRDPYVECGLICFEIMNVPFSNMVVFIFNCPGVCCCGYSQDAS